MASDASVVEVAERLASVGRFAGALLVAQDGQVVATGAWGPADRATGVPNTERTRFNVASVGVSATTSPTRDSRPGECGCGRWTTCSS